MTRLVTFQLADSTYALDTTQVVEILRPQTITPVPRAPALVAGLLNLRGRIIAAIDLRTRLGLPRGDAAMNILVTARAGPVSLLVDRIGDVIEVDAARFSAIPDTTPSVLRGVVIGSYSFPDRLVLVLDADRIVVSDEERAAS